MEGIVLGIDMTSKQGAIKGDDGNRYSFTMDEWKNTALPQL